MKNIILNTDSYKASHFLQYPEGTEYITSYIEARGSEDPTKDRTLFFGLQAFILDYLSKPITISDIVDAKEIFEAHGVPFNEEGWFYILEEHNGYLPIKIEAVQEGTVVPVSNVLVQVTNTDPKVPWLVSYLETALLRAIWYPTTVATNSWYIKQDLLKFAEESSDNPDVSFKLHDFGARGVSSNESAMLGGMAHLVNFSGTDTVASLVGARKYYNATMPGFSIPAAEHSTITVWGQESEDEVAAYRNMLDKFAKPGGMVAVVSDSYDIYNATDNIWGGSLKSKVETSGATIIVRPDSGDPTTVPVEIISRLMTKYGFTVNDKGYYVLPDCIRVIQGDGINRDSIQQIIINMKEKKLSLDNIAFGMGGALLQHMNRDTFKFAMKACHAVVNGIGRDVYKNPVGDSGKRSKRGRLGLYEHGGTFITDIDGLRHNNLTCVYNNGELYVDDTFDNIRKRSQIGNTN